MNKITCCVSLAALVAAAPAFGQTSGEVGEQVQVLADWAHAPLYTDGWSVDRVLDDTTVIGPSGDEIGYIENLIFDQEGQVIAVIAEVGGFWDIGDTHVSIPWEQVDLSPTGPTLEVPVTEENADDYPVFGERSFFPEEQAETIAEVDDDLATEAGVFKATDLIGDYAYLEGNERYGYVSDLIVSNGKLEAVVIDASAYGTPGTYAYPYYHTYRPWAPGGWRYNLPYGAEDIEVIDTFDYSEMVSQSAQPASETRGTNASGDEQSATQGDVAGGEGAMSADSPQMSDTSYEAAIIAVETSAQVEFEPLDAADIVVVRLSELEGDAATEGPKLDAALEAGTAAMDALQASIAENQTLVTKLESEGNFVPEDVVAVRVGDSGSLVVYVDDREGSTAN